jgi:hypothetical protein
MNPNEFIARVKLNRGARQDGPARAWRQHVKGGRCRERKTIREDQEGSGSYSQCGGGVASRIEGDSRSGIP